MAEHAHTDAYGRNRSQRVLMMVFSITVIMFVVELVGGILSNSLALIGDSGHMLMDSVALGVSVLAFKFARKPVTVRKTYGYYRLEILAALANGVLLVFVSLYIFYEAFLRLTGIFEVQAQTMFSVAVAGLVVNLVAVYLLWGSKEKNLNVKGAFLHVFADMISSIGVIIAAVIIYFTGAFVVDSFMGILIGGIILRSAFGLLSESSKVLLESAPEGIDVDDVINSINKVKGVRSVHDMHIWSISSGINALSGHVVIEDQMVSKSRGVLKKITRTLENNFVIVHTTLQLECEVCVGPTVCGISAEEKH